MPNEAFGRLNVKTAPFYLAFRNLSSIDSNHKKIRVCVFQNKSGQVDKYRDEKHKIVLQKKSCSKIFLQATYRMQESHDTWKLVSKTCLPVLASPLSYIWAGLWMSLLSFPNFLAFYRFSIFIVLCFTRFKLGKSSKLNYTTLGI